MLASFPINLARSRYSLPAGIVAHNCARGIGHTSERFSFPRSARKGMVRGSRHHSGCPRAIGCSQAVDSCIPATLFSQFALPTPDSSQHIFGCRRNVPPVIACVVVLHSSKDGETPCELLRGSPHKTFAENGEGTWARP